MAEKLTVEMSSARLRGALLGHEKLLVADAGARDLAPAVAEKRQDVKASARALEDAEENLAALIYVALARDDGADAIVKAFTDALYNACGRRRDDPRFIAALPSGQAHVTQPRLWEQLQRLDEYLPNWTALARTDALVAEWLPRLREGRDALQTPLDALKPAHDAKGAADWSELRARMGAVAIWDSDFGELMTRFPGDRRRVESFFPRLRARAEAEAGEPAPAVSGGSPASPAAPGGTGAATS